MWRQTNNCSKHGKIDVGGSHSCGEEVCYGLSGWCDCNGNSELDADEASFDCRENEHGVTPPVVCNKRCKNFNCTYALHTGPNCTDLPGTSSLVLYGYAKYFRLDQTFKSVMIGMDECQMTVYSEHVFKGSSETLKWTSQTGRRCQDLDMQKLNHSTGSVYSTDHCSNAG